MAINNVINQKQAIPSFKVVLANTIVNATGNSVNYDVIYDTVTYDSTASYNIATGIWTCPQSGNYAFGASSNMTGFSSAAYTQRTISFLVGASTHILEAVSYYFSRQNNTVVSGTKIFPLAIGNTVNVRVLVLGGAQDIGVLSGNNTYFFGYLINP